MHALPSTTSISYPPLLPSNQSIDTPKDTKSFIHDWGISCTGYLKLHPSMQNDVKAFQPRLVTILLGKKQSASLQMNGYQEEPLHETNKKRSVLLIGVSSEPSSVEKTERVYISVIEAYTAIFKSLSMKFPSCIENKTFLQESFVGEILRHSLGKKKIMNLTALLNAIQEKASFLSPSEMFSLYGHHLRLPFIIHIKKTDTIASIRLEKKSISSYPLQRLFSCPISSTQDLFTWSFLEKISKKESSRIQACVAMLSQDEILEAIEGAKKGKTSRISLQKMDYFSEEPVKTEIGNLKICPIRDKVECLLTIYSDDFLLGEGSHKYVYKTFSLWTGQQYATSCSRVDNDEIQERAFNASIVESSFLTRIQNECSSIVTAPCLNFTIEQCGQSRGYRSEMVTALLSRDLCKIICDEKDRLSTSDNEGLKNSGTEQQEWYLSMPLFSKDGIEKPEMQKRKLSHALQICKQIEQLHAIGIVHNDVKPANILVSISKDKQWEGTAITDFGLSHLAQITGKLSGSFLYLSPELIKAFFNKEDRIIFSPKQDIWSLGITLYEFFYGRMPKTKFAQYDESFIVSCLRRRQQDRYDTVIEEIERGLDKESESDVYARTLCHFLKKDSHKRSNLTMIISQLEKELERL